MRVPQIERGEAVRRLIARIENEDLPGLNQTGARTVFADLIADADGTRCVVCDVPLVGRQENFCAGHWDYLVVNITTRQPFHNLVREFGEWLQRHLTNPEIRHYPLFWLEVIRGYVKCEVCGGIPLVTEGLWSDSGELLKKHSVCADHVSFRCVEDYPTLNHHPSCRDDQA